MLPAAQAASARLITHLKSPDLSKEGLYRARDNARLLDAVGMQLLFAYSPSGERGARTSPYPASAFLRETSDILEILTEHGTPHTNHQLLELLESLVDEAPDQVWDLIAKSILLGGKTHGYAAESMGVDLYVRLVGRYLADHKAPFDTPHRRKSLLDTLETFIDVGWPAARKLLNDLHGLLR